MLKIEDVEWHGEIFLDRNFRAFRYNGDYYKATLSSNTDWGQQESAPFLLDQLAKEGFIPPTEPCHLQVEHCGRIYRQYHEHFNLQPEWLSAESLREAAILFCKFNLWLCKRGMGLMDGHCYNFVFHGPMQPKWCDIGSIITIKQGSSPLLGLEQFVQYLVYPLLLRQKYPNFDSFCRLMGAKILSHEAARELGLEIRVPPDREKALIKLLSLVEALDFPTKTSTWGNYYNDDSDFTPPQISGSPYGGRGKIFTRIIESLKPATIVDLGANAGHFSRYMAKLGSEVLAVEPDETAVFKHHRILRDTSFSHKLKLMVASVAQAPKQQGELATALALTHHLFFTNEYHWKYIAQLFASFTSRDLLTEFMPNALSGSEKPDYLPENYRIECFAKHLERHFNSVEILDYPVQQGDAPRIFLLCRNKRERPLSDGWGPWPHDE